MRFVAAQQNAFTSGELSPRLHHRVDLKAYQSGAKSLANMIVLRQGGVTRRPGTVFVDYPLNSSQPTRLVPFRRSLGVNFVLEFGHFYIRFYRDHGVIGGSTFNIGTPWSGSQIADLRFAQSADVLYIAHPNFQPYKLSHLGDTTWNLALIAQKAGPLLPENTDQSIVITTSGTTGTINLFASAALWDPGDTGGIWKPEVAGRLDLRSGRRRAFERQGVSGGRGRRLRQVGPRGTRSHRGHRVGRH